MAKKQLKDLTVASAVADDDILHIQNAIGFDRQVTKTTLLETTQDQIDILDGEVDDLDDKIDKRNSLETEEDGYIAIAGEEVVMNNSTSNATLTLPSAPLDGEWVNVSGVGLYSNFPVFVTSTTKDIMIASDKSCELDEDSDGSVFRFWFDIVSDKWKIRKFAIEGEI